MKQKSKDKLKTDNNIIASINWGKITEKMADFLILKVEAKLNAILSNSNRLGSQVVGTLIFMFILLFATVAISIHNPAIFKYGAIFGFGTSLSIITLLISVFSGKYSHVVVSPIKLIKAANEGYSSKHIKFCYLVSFDRVIKNNLEFNKNRCKFIDIANLIFLGTFTSTVILCLVDLIK